MLTPYREWVWGMWSGNRRRFPLFRCISQNIQKEIPSRADEMPWLVRKVGEKWKVYKEGENGQPTGEARGTFDTEEEARQQQKALYVGVKESQVEDTLI